MASDVLSAVRVIIQARTDSTRLPAKALLPICDSTPSAILAAMRAANTGLQVILATSDRDIDDMLANIALDAGLAVFRGDAENVRRRFLMASKDLSDDAIIVRLTADNMVPDGAFLEEQIGCFIQSGRAYQSVEMVWQNPPYGLAAEIMRLGALRSLASQIDTPEDREHVTWSFQLHDRSCLQPKNIFSAKDSAVRCTMDSFDDYRRVLGVFKDVRSPTEISWRELLTRFTELPDASPGFSRGGSLVLGTAQLASPYGSAKKVTPPELKEGIQLIHRAISFGAAAIDTARAYIGSEATIGMALKGGWCNRTRIVTKLSPLSDLTPNSSTSEVVAATEINVLRSMKALGEGVKPTLMLHRASHLSDWGGVVWKRLIELRNEGLIADLGVSVQSPEEARSVISDTNVKLIQMPFNVLDWRWIDAGIPDLLATRPDIQVHVRSVFLQGLLLRPPNVWPKLEDCVPFDILGRLERLATAFERLDVADLCIAWVRSHNWINGLVIGMERLEQLHQNAVYFSREALTIEHAASLREALPRVPITLLNPALWPKLHA